MVLAPVAGLGNALEAPAARVATQMTEADLFTALDPAIAGVSLALARYQAGDLAGARRELAAHMARRQRPVFPEHRFPSVETDAMALLYPGGPGPYASGAPGDATARPLRTAGGARKALAAADGLRSTLRGNALLTSPPPPMAPPAITGLSTHGVPPQPGLAGAQPGIRVAWRTDRHAFGRVFCQGPDGPLQRSFASSAAATDHRVDVPHLLPGATYRLRAVAWDEFGRLAESAEVHASTEAQASGGGP